MLTFNALFTLDVCVYLNVNITEKVYQNQSGGGSRIYQRGAPTPGEGCANLLFCKIVAENCMKMNEFGLGASGQLQTYIVRIT